MINKTNILILSCGRRNKIIQYFKRELAGKGKVIATDCSKHAPALYEADKHYIVPRINEEGYLDTILSICKQDNIKGILSLIDPELNLLAKHKKDFLGVGVVPIISDYDVVELCFDKFRMYQFLVRKGFKAIKSYIYKEQFYKDVKERVIDYPVFVKPIRGSASININKAYSQEEVEILFNRFDNLMIQEFMNGTEYGADCYIDLISSEPITIFTKKKIKMRAGETDKSISIKDERLFALIKSFVKMARLRGVIDIDIFKKDNEYYISEVNPRFGGGYPHGYECGVNIPKMIINNINGTENMPMIDGYDQGICMMKYSDLIIGKLCKQTKRNSLLK